MKVISYIKKGKVTTISIDDLKKLKVELTTTWENACTKCGKCCFEKSLNPNGVLFIDYNKPCQYLKYIGKKAECSIYSKRFDECNNCNTIPEAIQKRYLPADCPYTKSAVAYRAPVDNGEFYKRAKEKLTKNDMYSGGDQPTGGTRNMPAKLPPRVTSMQAQGLARQNLPDWKRRKKENDLRSQGKAGMLDAKETTVYTIKPSGHAGGG
jgi:hypothetical protein